jgi:hypothetical protein
MTRITLALGCFFLLPACGSSGATPAPDAGDAGGSLTADAQPNDDAPGDAEASARPDPSCPAIWSWSVPSASGTTATIAFASGGFVLDASGAVSICSGTCSNEIALWQNASPSDFSATFTVSDVSGSGAFDGVSAFVDDGLGGIAKATLMSAGGAMNVSTFTLVGGQVDDAAKPTNANEGTLAIQSTNGMVTVTASAGGVSVSSSAALSAPSLRTGIALETSLSAGSSAAPKAHARLTKFEASGVLKSDSFACDSRD